MLKLQMRASTKGYGYGVDWANIPVSQEVGAAPWTAAPLGHTFGAGELMPAPLLCLDTCPVPHRVPCVQRSVHMGLRAAGLLALQEPVCHTCP